MNYIKDAKNYFKLAPFDWINRTLKATNKCSEESEKNQNKVLLPKILSRKTYGLVGIRTPGQSVKSRLLYLAELQAQIKEKLRNKQRLLIFFL